MFVMSYLIANKWGSTIEQTRTFKADSLWEAKSKADRFLLNMKSKGKPVFPLYDLVEESVA